MAKKFFRKIVYDRNVPPGKVYILNEKMSQSIDIFKAQQRVIRAAKAWRKTAEFDQLFKCVDALLKLEKESK